MGDMFKEMLRADESLFRDTVALDYDYIPKVIPFREQQQRYIASCIKPLMQKRNGKNVFTYGTPGVGKTVAVKHLFNELEEETEEVLPIYINCWQRNTSFKIFSFICEQLGHKFIQNKKTEELFTIAKADLNKRSVVFCFDEIDKVDDLDFLYLILEEIYRKTILLITNYKEWLAGLDARIKSRLMAEMLEFKPYNETETKEILKQRLEYAFVPGVWDDEAFNLAAKKTFELKDIRSGLYLLKEAGNLAEDKSSRKILLDHVNAAIKKLDEFSIKSSEDLETETKMILDLVREKPGNKIGDLYKAYQENGGKMVYKTFQRKIKKLADNKFLSLERVTGKEGNTTIVKLFNIKKLDEF